MQKSPICEIGIICTCSDHGQSRYQIWIKCDKRQMTSCVHKMCERTYGQTNMKRALTLANINHPWNRYNMCMLRSWPTKIPNMIKIQQKTNDQLRTQGLGTDERTDKGIPVYPPLCEWGYNYIYGGSTGFRSPNNKICFETLHRIKNFNWPFRAFTLISYKLIFMLEMQFRTHVYLFCL